MSKNIYVDYPLCHFRAKVSNRYFFSITIHIFCCGWGADCCRLVGVMIFVSLAAVWMM